MILAAQHIRVRCKGHPLAGKHIKPMITPFAERTVANGFTYGLSACGYDVRIAERVVLEPGGFILASTIERFDLPHDLRMTIADKSSWARRGIAVQNTIAEPGWKGHLTLELTNHNPFGLEVLRDVHDQMLIVKVGDPITIEPGTPIAQVVFELLLSKTEQPYKGRYQDQAAKAQPAIYAKEGDQ